ncbi:MAG: exopolyphosphatase [Lactobacillus ruminis]|nr:exopolyphosphatase [Ligilactobacillus ruminis]
MKNLVMLDLGSNSTRMSINQVDDKGNFTEVKRMKQMTRMAEGMGASGTKKLEDKAIERTLNALRDFQKEYQNMPNLTVRGIATAAVRSAENSLEFLERVKELTGVDIEVLSGSAEAYYDYVGVINSLNVRDCVICDMGGGSFELAVVVDKEAVSYVSIPYGAVSLAEKFNAHDKISAQDLFKFYRFVLYKFRQLPWLLQGTKLPLVLLGGANRTVARKELMRLGRKDLENIHGVSMSAYSFIETYTEWLGMDRKERADILGPEAERADIIIAGLSPIMFLIEYLQTPEIIFSESGVREGVLYSMLKRE